MSTTLSLLMLLGALACGMLLGRLNAIASSRVVDRLVTLSLYALLLSMGFRLGRNPEIAAQLPTIGLVSISLAAATAAGTAVVLGALRGWSGRARANDSTGAAARSADRAHSGSWETLLLLALVVAGFLVGYLAPLFAGKSGERLTVWLLYALLLCVGMQLMRNGVSVRAALLHPNTILVPASTLAGSLAGGAAVAFAFGIPLGKGLALASGFGWYSLSGVLITNMGDPVLGSVAFLANLFREGLALLTIPLFARSRLPELAVGVAGATSMDVTLPLIERSCGAAAVPLAVTHGALLSFLVPFLVPLFFRA